MLRDYDYVIVGGGTAGLVLAARLSENNSNQILVVEAGVDQSDDPRVLTPALWPTLVKTPSDWAFKTLPQEELGGREIEFPQGRMLGGSSGINGHAFTPTSRSNIEAWEKLGNKGWGWDTMKNYFRKSYTLAKPSEEVTKHLMLECIDESTRGAEGPIQLSFPNEPENEWAKAWLATMSTLGYPPTADPFSGDAQGAYINAESVDPTAKQRSYAGNTYLHMSKSRSNVSVETGAMVEKIILKQEDGSTPIATGLQYSKNGDTHSVIARKEIILCAGAFNSPRLLELSGVGDAELLRRHGIHVVVDNSNVGENLQNHPMCGLSYEVASGLTTIDALARQEPTAVGAAMEAYSAKQAGPFAHSGTFASAQISLAGLRTEKGAAEIKELLKSRIGGTGSEFDKIHTEYVHNILTAPHDASGYLLTIPSYAAFLPNGSMAPPPSAGGDYFSVAVLLTNPLSRGSAHIASASSADKPNIDPAYFSNSLDLEILARHLDYVDKVVTRTEPLKSRLKPDGKRNEGAPVAFTNLDTVKDYLRRTCVGAHHFTGTCSMMSRELGGVVDSKMRVYGVENLRVCDASIIPFVSRTNPQATIYAVAERGADLIKASKPVGLA